LPVINPSHLLDQASKLATPAGPGAARQADLRRAISASYYAVFHAIAAAAADDLIGATQQHTARYSLAYRSIVHHELFKLCDALTKANISQKYAPYLPAGPIDSDLKDVASAVTMLQQKRHAADYDPLFRATTTDVTFAIQEARGALALLKRANPAARKAFLALVIFDAR